MEKTKRGLKPSSSSKAVGPKQKRAKLSAQKATELSRNHRNPKRQNVKTKAKYCSE